jgi:predicted transcriptional regulator
MKRTTVLLPDDVAKLLKLEAERRGVTPSLVIREAVATYVAGPPTERRVLKFANIASGGPPHDTAARAEEMLKEILDDVERDVFGRG